MPLAKIRPAMDTTDTKKTAPTTADTTTAVPAAAVLNAWNSHSWDDGLHIEQLSALERLTVLTQHSTYEIVVVSPGTAEILVRGGEFFPQFTAARLAGSTLGGSFLKMRSIHVGFRIEFAVGRGVIVTSPVRTITVAPAPRVSGVM
jgi:hypothetical protein